MRLKLIRTLHHLLVLTSSSGNNMKKFLQITPKAPSAASATASLATTASKSAKLSMSNQNIVNSADSPAISSTEKMISETLQKIVSPDTATAAPTLDPASSSPYLIPPGSIPLPRELQSYVSWQQQSGSAGPSAAAPVGPLPYAIVVQTFEDIAKVSGRIEKENCLSCLYSSLLLTCPTELATAVYLTSNTVSPVYEGLELGIGDSLLIKAICEATGRKKEVVEELYEKLGDLGLVAVSSRQSQTQLSFGGAVKQPKALEAREVLENFRTILKISGNKAQSKKVDVIKAMMVRCKGEEAKYLIRALQGKLRIGTASQTVLVALAHSLLEVQEMQRKEKQRASVGGGVSSSSKAMAAAVEAEVEGEGDDLSLASSASSVASSEAEVVESDEEEEEMDFGGDKGSPKKKKLTKLKKAKKEKKVKVKGKKTTATMAAAEEEETAVVAEVEMKTEEATSSTTSSAKDLQSLLTSSSHLASLTWQQLLQPPYLNPVEPADAKRLRLHFTSDQASSSTLTQLKLAAESMIKRCYSECPNYYLLVQHALHHPLHLLDHHVCLVTGVPIAPMLAKPTKSILEVLQRLEKTAFAMEFKYDGERAQIHLINKKNHHDTEQDTETARNKGTVKIFSRNSEDNSEKYPDLCDVIHEVVAKATQGLVYSLILDCEVVAYDRIKQQLLPFQVLSTRKRKAAVEDEVGVAGTGVGGEDKEAAAAEQPVKVILQAFDLLSVNNISLLRTPFRIRRALLTKVCSPIEGYFHLAQGLDQVEDGDTAPIEGYLAEAISPLTGHCEGLMIKTLDGAQASYEPSKRSLNWLKVKKDYIAGLGVCDSVDLVVIGGYMGRGKRSGTYGAYLMACYDASTDSFQSVCKVGTGFKDEDLTKFTALFNEHHLIYGQGKRDMKPPSNYQVRGALYPDEWFHPRVVWELAAADLSRSSTHTGGIGFIENDAIGKEQQEERGIGLRFPRYLRERPDKKAEQATNSEQIVDLFRSQDGSTGAGGGGKGGGKDKGNDEEDDDEWL